MYNQNELVLKLYDKLETIERALIQKEKPFLSLDELVGYLGIARNTVYQWTSRNLIPHYKVGKKLMFKISEIDNWVLNNKNKVKSNDEIESEAATQIVTNRRGGRR